MNTAKFFIPFIIFIILIKFSTLAFKNEHKIFSSAVKNIVKIKNSPKHCSCHKKEALSKMTAVEFMRDGHKYLISEKPIGQGGTAMIFHAIYFGQEWEMLKNKPTKCVAIKVALKGNTPEETTKNREAVTNELKILKDIFQPNEECSVWPRPSHNLYFIRSEIFEVEYIEMYEQENISYAIVMELGQQNLYKYWQEAMGELIKQQTHKISERILLYILREISLGLDELHQKNYVFIDLKPENVIVMPNSPDPKTLFDDNYGKLKIKLTDFGAALKFEPDENGKQKLDEYDKMELITSFFYRAPELYSTDIDEISLGTDIYSLGRLMLMLAVQTPQIKTFWKELDENFVENYQNWIQLVDKMLYAVKTPRKITQMNVDYNSDSSDEIVIDADSLGQKEDDFKKLYEEMKRNYGDFMKIIEQTQANEFEQEKRLSAKTIVEECSRSPKLANLEHSPKFTNLEHSPKLANLEHSTKLAHLERRNQTERKLIENSISGKLFYSGLLTTRSSATTYSSGSSTSKGSSSKSSKGGRRRYSLGSFPFLN